MLKRAARAAFGGAWVFPGGVLDDHDRDARLYGRCLGIDDASASRALSVPRNGLAYWVAGIRETFEESGLLMAVNGSGQAVHAGFATRQALHAGRIRFEDLCRRGGWRLPAHRLHYVAHWITPSQAPRRFSTRFFLAAAAPAARIRADGREVLRAHWYEPREALRQEIPLAHPTRHFLRILAGLGSVEKALDWAGGLDRRSIPIVRPEVQLIGGKLMSCLPTGEVLGPFSKASYPGAAHSRPAGTSEDAGSAGLHPMQAGGVHSSAKAG